MRRRLVQVVTWLTAVVLATGLGLFAVNAVGSAVRDRGPMGQAVTRSDVAGQGDADDLAVPDESDRLVTRELTDDYGSFEVSCQGPYARGVSAAGDAGAGWHLVRFEPGPDDDVEAVFASDTEFVEIEVFCDGGTPAVAELDRSRFASDD